MRYELTTFNSERFMIHQSLVILNLRTKYQNLDKVVQLRAIFDTPTLESMGFSGLLTVS